MLAEGLGGPSTIEEKVIQDGKVENERKSANIVIHVFRLASNLSPHSRIENSVQKYVLIKAGSG